MGSVILACFKHRGGDVINDMPVKSVLDCSIKKLEDDSSTQALTLKEHAPDKKAYLFVNVASSWGLTPANYKQLVQMHDSMKDRGLSIMAFPINTFGQEKGSPEDIIKLARGKYGAEFLMFEKVEANGPKAHQIYSYLRRNSSLYNERTKSTSNLPWSWSKFLVNGEGQVVKFYPPEIYPEQIKPDIEMLFAGGGWGCISDHQASQRKISLEELTYFNSK
jgi:glutathione peroxidase